MSLNIKNERTHALVRELAAARGVSQTEAVEEAVARRLHELSAHQTEDATTRPDRLLSLAAAIVENAPAGALDDATDWLYDDNGLPT